MSAPTTTEPATTLRCRLGWVPTVEWAGLFLADRSGALARAGLAVEVVPGGPGCEGAAAAVAAGRAEVGLASDALAALGAIAAGAPLVVVGAVMGVSPLGLAWPAARGPITVAALSGAHIGAGAPADQGVLDALFERAGVRADYRFSTIGHGVEELAAGAIDAMCCSVVNQPPAAARRGLPLETATFAELGLPLPADVVVVDRGLVVSQRAVVVAFLRALAAGWVAVALDPAAAARQVHAEFGAAWGYDEHDALDEISRQAPFVGHAEAAGSPPLWIDRAALAASLGALATPVIDLDTAIDLGPLAEAMEAR